MYDKRCSEKADVVSVWSGTSPRSGLSRLMDLCSLTHTHMFDKRCSEKADVVSVWSVSIHEVDLVDYGLVQSDTHTHVRQALL